MVTPIRRTKVDGECTWAAGEASLALEKNGGKPPHRNTETHRGMGAPTAGGPACRRQACALRLWVGLLQHRAKQIKCAQARL